MNVFEVVKENIVSVLKTVGHQKTLESIVRKGIPCLQKHCISGAVDLVLSVTIRPDLLTKKRRSGYHEDPNQNLRCSLA